MSFGFKVEDKGEGRFRKEYSILQVERQFASQGLEIYPRLEKRYRLKMEVFTEFWAEPSEFDRKEAQARRMANAFMFKDMIPLVEEILLDSNQEEVSRLAHQLRKMMEGQ